MTRPVEVLEAEVLRLPAADRSRLLDKLVASLEVNPEWEEAWAQEADQREAEISSGRSSWVSGDEAISRLRAKLT